MRKTSYKESQGQEKYITRLLHLNINRLIEPVVKNAQGRILDVGCGNQPFKSYFIENGWQYEGMDVCQNDFNSVDHIYKIDSTLALEKTYDLIFCTEVLEHVLNWDVAFSNFKKLIKKKGFLFITVPFFYPPHEEPYDYWRPTQYAIQEYAKKAGFDIVIMEKAGDAWDMLGTLCSSVFLQPKNKSIKSKILYLILYKIQKWLRVKLDKRTIQNNIEAQSKHYMSNIFLLQKK